MLYYINMETLHVDGLENNNLKVVQAKPRKVPKTMPRLSFLGAIVGSRNSGKTNAFINLIKFYDTTKSFDKIYLFSPTYQNDPKYQLLDNDEKHYELSVYQTYNNEIFKDVLEDIKRDIEEYKKYEKLMKIYKKFLRVKKIESLDAEELLELSLIDFEKPETKYKLGMPTSLLIFDDLVGNKDLYRADAKGLLNSFIILHRHLLTSVLFISQIWNNAVPRQIRNNLSLLMLFRNKNDKMKGEIGLEMSSVISVEDFVRLWNFATEPDYSFFMIDFDAKKRECRFRRNFNELISFQPTCE